MKRSRCIIAGCNNLASTVARKKNGQWRFRKECSRHHRERYGMKNSRSLGKIQRLKEKLRKSKRDACERCGWNKGWCDMHRLNPGRMGGKYTLENIIVLCPNCHRIEHQKREE